MDSGGNSGSLQSSSGGDEEYDSRAAGAGDSFSAFMGVGGGHIPNPPPSFFDPLANYLQLHHNTNPPLLDPNPPWPRTNPPRPDPTPAPTSSTAPAQPNPNPSQSAPRNPKKRSRASRRAPTTVLTTDTTNFRAMVQEFTGIPAPPFDGGVGGFPFPRARLDLFGPSRSAGFSPQPPTSAYLRRPFAQKIHPPPLPFLTSSTTSSSSTPSAAVGGNYETPQNLFQNPFAGLLQTSPKFPFSDQPTQFTSGGGLSFMPSDQISQNNSSEKDKEQGRDQHGLNLMTSSLNGGYDFPVGGDNSKTSTNFLDGSGGGGGKRLENATNNAAGEGMVESWICSSE
ncbi:VQ motif-containing protein [Striga hermonthica]|uniref:VQ motif-containing protein n=1 Tax=Striga hermonthica TaxID=68872 RepID=A0A9N7NLJ3_STRHE|nr:VQ motif-containing protein [Striga hermonthica]